MTIEFDCPHCSKPLKTTDDKAGRQAKCPGCGQLIEVPSTEGTAVDRLDSSATTDVPENVIPPIPSASDNSKPCPACAVPIPISSIRCQHCGAVFLPDRASSRFLNIRDEICPFPPGEVIADAWRIFSEQMGLLIGSFLAMWVLILVTGLFASVPFALSQLLFDRDEWVGAAVAAGVGTACAIGALASWFHLLSGYLNLQIKAAREQPVEFSDLFTGGRFAFRMLLNSIVFGLIVSTGTAMCIVPGVLLTLMFWSYGHILVDEDQPGLRSLSRAKALTDGNWGSLFIVFLVATGSLLAGYCACGIGLLVAAPYVNLLFALSYHRMSCQTVPNAIQAV